VVYLHYAHAIGMERLALLMDELFSLSISEGAISNILARARQPLLAARTATQAVVLASPVVCSDETSARVTGKTWWEWVFVGALAVLHTIQPSRGKAIVTALFGDARPGVWVSDMLGSQRGHGVLVEGRNVVAELGDQPAGRLEREEKQLQQGGFPGAGGASEELEGVRLNAERQVAQHLRPETIAQPYVLESNHARLRCQRPARGPDRRGPAGPQIARLQGLSRCQPRSTAPDMVFEALRVG